jgi:hypothetical protein
MQTTGNNNYHHINVDPCVVGRGNKHHPGPLSTELCVAFWFRETLRESRTASSQATPNHDEGLQAHVTM